MITETAQNRGRLLLGVVVLAVIVFGGRELLDSRTLTARDDSSIYKQVSAKLLALPVSFEPNRGQTDSGVKLLTHGPGSALFLSPNEVVLSLHQTAKQERYGRASSGDCDTDATRSGNHRSASINKALQHQGWTARPSCRS